MSDYRPHDGGKRPCRPAREVKVLLRGFEDSPGPTVHVASTLRWDHRGVFGDIVAWIPA